MAHIKGIFGHKMSYNKKCMICSVPNVSTPDCHDILTLQIVSSIVSKTNKNKLSECVYINLENLNNRVSFYFYSIYRPLKIEQNCFPRVVSEKSTLLIFLITIEGTV